MKLIFGLGNPEKDYKGTRHNVGFEVVNKLAYDYNIDINKAKFRGHIGEGLILGKKVMLVKPQTYMNLSGECVRDVMSFYKVGQEDIIIIYDDVHLPPGKIRIREKGSAGGHNGIKNILYHLESDEFLRIRVGVGEASGRDLADYVTGRFKPGEMPDIIEGITKAGDAVGMILKDGVQAAMNRLNGGGEGAIERNNQPSERA